VAKQNGVPTVGEVIQEHIDLLVRPSAGTVRTYQTMLNLHIRNVLGSVPVDKLDYRQITHWIRAMKKKDSSAKTIRVLTGARFGEATAVTVADVLFSCRWGKGTPAGPPPAGWPARASP